MASYLQLLIASWGAGQNWIVISHRFLRDLCLLINWPVAFIIPPSYFRDMAFCSASFRWCEHGLDGCRWCTVTQSRKERRRTVKRKRRYRRVFRYRIPYHAHYQIVDETNNGLRSRMAEKIDFKRTWKPLELLRSLLILIGCQIYRQFLSN